MTVKEIVLQYLVQNGYDGLSNGECICENADLMCCCELGWTINCKPGYKVPCDPETCKVDGDCD